MTCSGALMSSTAASSTSVTHRQHGQMHEMGSLHHRQGLRITNFTWNQSRQYKGVDVEQVGRARTR